MCEARQRVTYRSWPANANLVALSWIKVVEEIPRLDSARYIGRKGDRQGGLQFALGGGERVKL